MWSTNTLWFGLAVVMSIFAVGSILFGHLEEHKPKPWRLLKVVLFAGIPLALSAAGLRRSNYLCCNDIAPPITMT